MTSLDRFDGQGWSQGDLTAPSSHSVDRGIPYPSEIRSHVATEQFHSNVVATDHLSVPWLPLPYPALAVSVDGDWRWDETSRAIFSTRETTQGRSWSATTARVEPTQRQLRHAAPGPSTLELAAPSPRIVPDVLVKTARRVTADATTAFDQALALQDYFHSAHFRYSTDVSDDDNGEVIAKFLADGRGYCVQFASTMALMARVLGIPARVAIGFTHGDERDDGSFLVTTHDAHTWPELYFDGIGWLPFEPTPRGDGQAEPPAYTRPAGADAGTGTGPQGQAASPIPSASSDAGGAAPKQDPSGLSRSEGGGATAGKGGDRGGGVSGQLVAALVALVLLAVAPMTTRRLTRRRRWARAETDAARAHAAWRELGDDVRDLGLRWQVDDSPRRAADRLQSATGVTGDALRRLAAAEERASYAPAHTTAADTGDPVGDERAVRRELARLVGRRQRLAALVAPRSTLTSVASTASGAVADLLDLADRGLAWVYRVIVPRRLRRG
jgi:transglutaminase-like putative cysteine protease